MKQYLEVLDTAIWSFTVSLMGAVARAASQNLGWKLSALTVIVGVLIGTLTGIIIADADVHNWVRNGAISATSIAGREIVDLVLRASKALRHKSDEIIDKFIKKS